MRLAPRALCTAVVAVSAVALTACGSTIAGTPTWPGETLSKAVLTAADFPDGVVYDRLTDTPGQPDGAGGPSAMLSKPAGCADAMTNVIAKSAERGPGSGVKYSLGYDGARMVVTVLSWNLDLDKLAAEAARCERFKAFFDPASDGIPMTTVELPAPEPGALVYRQTMTLGGAETSIYMSFQNIGPRAVFGIAFPIPNPTIKAKAELPQTFLDVTTRQAARLKTI